MADDAATGGPAPVAARRCLIRALAVEVAQTAVALRSEGKPHGKIGRMLRSTKTRAFRIIKKARTSGTIKEGGGA